MSGKVQHHLLATCKGVVAFQLNREVKLENNLWLLNFEGVKSIGKVFLELYSGRIAGDSSVMRKISESPP
jgi:hypothetical protein